MNHQNLYDELQAIARNELWDVLDSWGNWTPSQAERLATYLTQEMKPGGMLSVDKARDAGQRLGRQRQEARRLLAQLQRAAPPSGLIKQQEMRAAT